MYYCGKCAGHIQALSKSCPHCGAWFSGEGTGDEADRARRLDEWWSHKEFERSEARAKFWQDVKFWGFLTGCVVILLGVPLAAIVGLGYWGLCVYLRDLEFRNGVNHFIAMIACVFLLPPALTLIFRILFWKELKAKKEREAAERAREQEAKLRVVHAVTALVAAGMPLNGSFVEAILEPKANPDDRALRQNVAQFRRDFDRLHLQANPVACAAAAILDAHLHERIGNPALALIAGFTGQRLSDKATPTAEEACFRTKETTTRLRAVVVGHLTPGYFRVRFENGETVSARMAVVPRGMHLRKGEAVTVVRNESSGRIVGIERSNQEPS